MADSTKLAPKGNKHAVIIAGAGPCGLVAALALQRRGIDFTVYERASREKLCSNVGSGFDLAPTAVDILKTKLSLDTTKCVRPYDNVYIADMNMNHWRTFHIQHLPVDKSTGEYGMGDRAGLQNALLNDLLKGKTEREQDEVLVCGVTVTGYENKDNHVLVTLSNGSTVQGSALLGCDGIHSAVREHMNKDVEDTLHYCGQQCWWGKTMVSPGSELYSEIQSTLEPQNLKDGSAGIWLMGNSKLRGAFFASPLEGGYSWAYVANQKRLPEANQSDDLTRRGGVILTEESKKAELIDPLSKHCKLVQLFIENGTDITRAGFFDRENLQLPYTDKYVALLGDAAHPQSPMAGMGAGMAIVDGYVVATRLAAAMTGQDASSSDESGNVVAALAEYDTEARRKTVNDTIHLARTNGEHTVAEGWFACWIGKMIFKWLPTSMLISGMISADIPNKDFVKAAEESLDTVMKS